MGERGSHLRASRCSVATPALQPYNGLAIGHRPLAYGPKQIADQGYLVNFVQLVSFVVKDVGVLIPNVDPSLCFCSSSAFCFH